MTTTMVGGEGLEPPKALGRLIYSQQLLPLSDPPKTIQIIRLVRRAIKSPPSKRHRLRVTRRLIGIDFLKAMPC